MTTILGICASPFTVGTTATVLKTALEAIEKVDPTVKIKMIYLDEDFPRHDGRRDEERYSLKKRISMLPAEGDLRKTVRAIMAADGIIFATPARNFGAEPRMMELFSWLMTTTDYPEYPLSRKIASFMTVCEEDGGQASNAQMWSAAAHLGFIADMPHYFNKFAKESEGNWQIEDQPEVGKSLLELVKITQPLRDTADLIFA